MNTRELFLKCCQAHQWTPFHINSIGSEALNSKSIDEELKQALDMGQLELCFDLIELAKTMNLQSGSFFNKLHRIDDLSMAPVGPQIQQVKSQFHNLTTDSKAILCDVVNGGLKEDLSLAFE